jgi:hypothetical protein
MFKLYPNKGRIYFTVDPDEDEELPAIEAGLEIETNGSTRSISMAYLNTFYESKHVARQDTLTRDGLIIGYNDKDQVVDIKALAPKKLQGATPEVDAYLEQNAEQTSVLIFINLLISFCNSTATMLAEIDAVAEEVQDMLNALEDEEFPDTDLLPPPDPED